MTEINDFITRRNEVLRTRDVDKVMDFLKEWNPDAVPKSSDVVEVGMHKSITAVASLPIEDRLASKKWLADRGYYSLDDGDL